MGGTVMPPWREPWGSLVRPSSASCQMKGSTSRMQGKEASEQETRQKSTAGIDVSKDRLDAHVLPQSKALQVPNTPEGISRLKRWLMQFKPELIAVEATSK